MKKLKDNKYLFFSLLFAIFLLFVLYLFFGWQTDVDTGSYLETITYFSNKDIESLKLLPHRALRPLAILFALPFTIFLSPLMSLIFENVLFYFATTFLIFKAAKYVLKNEELAFYSVVFYLTSYPFLRFGPVALTDMPAWFFYLLSIYLTLLFLKNPKNYLIYFNGFISGLGVLVKENAGVGILFFLALLIFSGKFEKKEIINYAFKFFLLFLAPILVNQFIIFYFLHYTYLDWYKFNTKIYLRQSYFFFNLAKNFFITFGFSWIFFLIGAVRILKEKHRENNKIYFSLLIPSLSFFLWPSITARLIYIAGPFLSLLAAKGLDAKKNNFYFKTFLLFSIIFNFVLVKLSYVF